MKKMLLPALLAIALTANAAETVKTPYGTLSFILDVTGIGTRLRWMANLSLLFQIMAIQNFQKSITVLVIRIYMPIAAIQGQRVIPKNITG